MSCVPRHSPFLKHTAYHFRVPRHFPKVKKWLSSQLFRRVQSSELLLLNCKPSSFRPRNIITQVYLMKSRPSTMIQTPFRAVNCSSLLTNSKKASQKASQTASKIQLLKKQLLNQLTVSFSITADFLALCTKSFSFRGPKGSHEIDARC